MERKKPIEGKIMWHDIITRDIDKAQQFYKDLLNWEYSDYETGKSEKYKMIKVGDKIIGGFVKPKDTNVHSHWSAYVTVDNVKEAEEKIKQEHGRIILESLTIPNIGRFAVTVDPEGATINLFEGNENYVEMQGAPQVGEFCWDELMGSDADILKNYYSKIFKWSFDERDMGEMGKYFIAKNNESEAAGIMHKAPGNDEPSYWISYIFVDNIDEKTEKAKKLGGKILAPPMQVPDVGKISIIEDPTGAVIGLFGDPAQR